MTVDLDAIRERATNESHPAYNDPAVLAADVLALVGRIQELEAGVKAMTFGRDFQYDKAVGWRNRAVKAEAERDTLREEFELFVRACTFTSSLPGDTGQPLMPNIRPNWERARAALARGAGE